MISDQAQGVLRALCRSRTTKVSGELKKLLSGSNIRKGIIPTLELDPASYNDPYSFAWDYGLVSFLRKYELGGNADERARNTVRGFLRSEARCRETNLRFNHGFKSSAPKHSGLREAHLFQMQRKIAAVLGEFSLKKVMKDVRWGPGATYAVKRRQARFDVKHGLPVIDVTAGALKYMRSLIESDPAWLRAILSASRHLKPFVGPEKDTEVEVEVAGPLCLLPSCFSVVSGNRIVTAKKDARKDRTIAIEPSGNSYLQQGVGRYIRKRLKQFGVNLDDQTLQQRRARDAWSSGLATLDLASASDTISAGLVAELLPLEWWLYLDDLRSHEGDGGALGLKRRVKYAKFSSMGNAFTFELESLIFWAAITTLDPNGSVYGDDIICRQSAAVEIVELLEFLGFEINKEKSFIYSQFYESCGKHYFRGVDVTPLYQKEPIVDLPSAVRGANRLLRWSLRLTNGLGYDKAVRTAWSLLVRKYETPIRLRKKLLRESAKAGKTIRSACIGIEELYGPYCEVGDDYCILPFWDGITSRFTQYGWEQPVYRVEKVSFDRIQGAALAYLLSRGSSRDVSDEAYATDPFPESGVVDLSTYSVEQAGPGAVKRSTRFIWESQVPDETYLLACPNCFVDMAEDEYCDTSVHLSSNSLW